MKTAIKLVLIYFGIQILSGFAAIIATVIYNVVQGNDISTTYGLTIAVAMYLGFAGMGIYLWKSGYISTDRRTWSPVSALYLAFTTLACLASVLIIEYVQTLMPKLPDLMEDTFDTLQAGWPGILAIALIGPVFEEVMFRGAITTALLKKYSPVKAIVLSALVFGIFHINPPQIITATLIGLLLGWIYYKTASLIPCILIHVINNSLSVYLSFKYSQAEYIRDIFAGETYYVLLIDAIILLACSIWWMKRTAIPAPWREEQ
jgi:membrane protease YdiL (CAAX protease family)